MAENEIHRHAIALLAKFYGYRSFRPGQLDIITAVASGRDVMVLMPTGGGKSICYQIPAIMLDGCAIVVSPLIALMQDQVQALIANGIPAAALNSNIGEAESRRILDNVYAGRIKLLYMSPERLMADIDRLSANLRISLFAIDEAHCISQWGHDFRPVYTALSRIKELYPTTPVMALTATADRVTREDIVRQLRLKEPYCYLGSFDRPNLSLRVVAGATKTRRISEITSLIKKYPTDSGIVYCLSRKTTEAVYAELAARGFRTVCYHAGMSAAMREQAQRAFVNGDAQVVCATVAFGMGIDKSNIRWVVHYNMPSNIESYYQEIGRAGRDGMPAETVMFYSVGDLVTLRRFAEEAGQSALAFEKLERMKGYAEATVCRRRVLLSYFNEQAQCDCGNCDVCKNPPKRIDGTVLAQKAMSAILRTGSEIGMMMTVDILRGSVRGELISKGYDRLKTYGVGRDLRTQDWNYYLLQMLQLGLIDMDYKRGNKLSVTAYGMEVLRGQRRIELSEYVAVQRKQPEPKRKGRSRSADSEKSLFELLKRVRRREADQIGIPAYMVFSDTTLSDMARRRPLSRDEFAQVSGVGEKKLERFWRTFVAAIKAFVG